MKQFDARRTNDTVGDAREAAPDSRDALIAELAAVLQEAREWIINPNHGDIIARIDAALEKAGGQS